MPKKPSSPSNHDILSRKIRAHLLESAALKHQITDRCLDSIISTAHLLADTFQAGNKLLLCGNGGSAADCQHLAAELVSCLTKEIDRPGLPAIALTTDTSYLTAFANDFGFAGVFERQVLTLGQPGDTLIAISTSGNSPNILRAVKAARQIRMSTVALTGGKGHLRKMAQVTISIPSFDTQYIQEASLTIEHILCGLIEDLLFDPKAARRNRKT
ncbi:MAG: SIS domain-containing protein [Proteobacteria bacterium]|nr:SIS domain-containing protein [Pseudomonadota bacterium]